MPRFRLLPPAPHLSVSLLATIWLAGGGIASAQVMTTTDPLAPSLQTDPRKPSTFQRSNRAPLSQAPGSAAFAPAPAASGAGRTGFNSTNAPRARAGKPQPGSATRAIAPGLPQAAEVSPYQVPARTQAQSAYAQAPGTPPPSATIGPIRKPLKKKVSETVDPYAPLGLRMGSFDLFPAVELTGGYSTNPSQSPNGDGAALYTVAPELRAQSNWSRHELKADLRGSYTGYSPDDTPTLSRPNINGKLDGRIDVTHATRIELGGRVLVATDNPGSPNLQAGLSKLPLYATFGGSAGLGQQFNRVDVLVTGDAERTAYQDLQLTDGTSASNEDRNYNQYGGKVRGSYELGPGVKPFVEVGVDQRKHDLNADFFGYQRDSRGITGSVGTSFELTRLLTGEASIGYVKRTYEDARLSDLSGLIGNASLIWTASALTTVQLTASSSVGELTIPGVSGIFYRDVGLQIDHSLRRWLIGSVKFGIGADTYKNGAVELSGTTTTVCNCVTTSSANETVSDRVDMRYAFGLGLTYKIDRSMQVKGEFRQQWLRSNVSGVNYEASIFMLGLRLQK